MEATRRNNAKVVDHYVGVLIQTERKYLIPEKMGTQIVAKKVLSLPYVGTYYNEFGSIELSIVAADYSKRNLGDHDRDLIMIWRCSCFPLLMVYCYYCIVFL